METISDKLIELNSPDFPVSLNLDQSENLLKHLGKSGFPVHYRTYTKKIVKNETVFTAQEYKLDGIVEVGEEILKFEFNRYSMLENAGDSRFTNLYFITNNSPDEQDHEKDIEILQKLKKSIDSFFEK
ncbi:hypothetical protein COU58_00360 [Candidatus Pacearchaeota archaeon CG10_big_fil_rev_8_21_14_0_10_32_42]|nr:MAG: hypothetical protein COU58_00360 [Candidatus Pacearchaeota archaeon CG10_big_fil_rev_8_21_14_0_10_32_42]